MNKLIATFAMMIMPVLCHPQEVAKSPATDGTAKSLPFAAYLANDEFEVFLRINFYEQNVIVPGQELYGELPGYLGKKRNSFCWVITSASVKDEDTAEIALINDYGSEDLTALLVRKNDSIYTLRQVSGSTIKVPRNGKWQKLPKMLELKRKN